MQGAEQSGCCIQLNVAEYTQVGRHVARHERQNLALSIVNPEEARCARESARCQALKQPMNERGSRALGPAYSVAHADNTRSRAPAGQ
jgi:hypothetical protein